ncbi:hypothetical protein CIHG_08999 [Coccidioides immitis H538.4]|uniref:Uncharacterized protein n=1 Tax=Coccidioides immitis H538.4 TaxID=396776 RepID=A0A0J8S3Y1_COCIT|nr:hypothetical protein CIHG_08999 [Coccidioides immitis H538.4]
MAGFDDFEPDPSEQFQDPRWSITRRPPHYGEQSFAPVKSGNNTNTADGSLKQFPWLRVLPPALKTRSSVPADKSMSQTAINRGFFLRKVVKVRHHQQRYLPRFDTATRTPFFRNSSAQKTVP